ncbi:hypothetical protein N9W34_06625 [Rickettsiales bacterium]|nr:hypothetical protein [Rickettsiales bacterium]
MDKIKLLIILLFLSSCTEMHSDFGWARPASLSMEPPDGPPEYQQGFRDGCESGYSGYSNNFNKYFYTWKQDPILAQDPVYYQIWKDAYAYCANYGMMVDLHGMRNWE